MKKVLSKALCMAMIMFIFIGITNNCFGVIAPSDVKPTESTVEINRAGNMAARAGITMAIRLIIIVVGMVIYLIPTMVVCKRNHTYKVAIILLNIFLGWTFIGWIGCLVWSFIDNDTNKASNDKYGDLAKLQKLKESGTITESEFEEEKAKVLNNNTTIQSNNGIFVICLILGICTMLVSWVPIFGILLGIISCIVCAISRKKLKVNDTKNEILTVGIICTILGLAIAIVINTITIGTIIYNFSI